MVAEQTRDAGFLGILGYGSVSQTITLPRTGFVPPCQHGLRERPAQGSGREDRVQPRAADPGYPGDRPVHHRHRFSWLRRWRETGATIQTDIYFTNDNRVPSGAFDIEVKAKEEDAGLLADKQRARVESIQPDATRVSSVSLSVPDQYNYVVEVIVWKNETIVKRGEGNVRLRPGMLVKNDTQFVTKKIETSQFVGESGYASAIPAPYVTKSPGFGAPLVLAALAALAVLVHLRRRQP